MATRTVVCPECAEPLPYGRLACPSCGALLASVAGSGRRTDAPMTDAIAEEPLLLPDDDETPTVLSEADASETDAPPADAPDADASPAEPSAIDAPPAEVPPADVAPLDARPAPPTWPEPAEIPSVLGEWTGPGWSDDLDVAPGTDVAVETPVESAAAVDEPYVPAGAYMPPSAVLVPEASAAPVSAVLAPEVSAAPLSAAPVSAGGPSAAPSAKPRRPGDAPLLADLPLDAPDDLPGWLVVAGAAAGAIGFFLPWAHRVIGASGDGYLSAWGFGALMNVPIFIAVFVTLALAVMPNRVPTWLRTGVLPLVVGGLVVGTVWPYVLYGPLNGRLGSVIEVFAGLLLVVGGLLALRAVRHAGTPPSV